MVRLYLDEDVSVLIALLLRSRDMEISTALDHDMLGKTDLEQLDFATKLGAAIVTHNRLHFERLFTRYVEEGKYFSGIIVMKRKDVYTLSQRLSKFALTHSTVENQIWYA